MHEAPKGRPSFFFLALALACSLAVTPPAAARSRGQSDDRTVVIPVGGSQVLRPQGGIERVVVGDPQILDVVSLAGQLLLTAKSAGETELTVLARGAGATSYHISAEAPIATLQLALKEAFPGEEQLTAHAAGGAVYLSGQVSDAATIEAAIRLANSLMLSGGRKVADVINLTTLATSQQVQISVKFVEVSRTSLKQLGFNAYARPTTEAGTQMAASVFGTNDPRNYYTPDQSFVGAQTLSNPNDGLLPMLLSPVQGAFSLSFSMNRWLPMTATLSLLEQQGVAKTLSEPTLVANSGEQAAFLVGGEFPVPVPDPLGRITMTFKKYGAQLDFTPTVMGPDTVHLSLDTTVSDIDRQTSVALGTTQVPGLTTRSSSTSVRMRDGQSFAIAGLLSDKIQAQDKKIPVLGDIPIVGMLFRNTNYQRSQQELIVLVSTRLVKPMDPGEVPPVVSEDEFNDPQDWALFLLGQIDRTKPKAKRGEGRAQVEPRRPAGARSQAAAGGLMGFSR